MNTLSKSSGIKFFRRLRDDIGYLKYTVFHPFDGFYELRFMRKRNNALIAIIFALYGFYEILSLYYTGMVLKTWTVYNVNSIFMFVSALFPYMVFALANWSVTTLFNGNGKLGDILMVLSYALVPKLLFDYVSLFLSNIIILDEVILLTAFNIVGMVIFCALVFFGLCVIHEYSAGKCIITLVVTAVAAIIIIFICILFLTILEKMFGFVSVLGTEIIKRWA